MEGFRMKRLFAVGVLCALAAFSVSTSSAGPPVADHERLIWRTSQDALVTYTDSSVVRNATGTVSDTTAPIGLFNKLMPGSGVLDTMAAVIVNFAPTGNSSFGHSLAGSSCKLQIQGSNNGRDWANITTATGDSLSMAEVGTIDWIYRSLRYGVNASVAPTATTSAYHQIHRFKVIRLILTHDGIGEFYGWLTYGRGDNASPRHVAIVDENIGFRASLAGTITGTTDSSFTSQGTSGAGTDTSQAFSLVGKLLGHAIFNSSTSAEDSQWVDVGFFPTSNTGLGHSGSGVTFTLQASPNGVDWAVISSVATASELGSSDHFWRSFRYSWTLAAPQAAYSSITTALANSPQLRIITVATYLGQYQLSLRYPRPLPL